MRISPPAISGLAASAPPDGLIVTPSPSPSASARISSWGANGAWSSATSTGPAPTPATSPAFAVDGETVRSRAPSECVSTRWSMPVIHAGRRPWRSAHSNALSPTASTTAAAPSVTGGSAWRRSGETTYSSASSSSTVRSYATCAFGLSSAALRARAATAAKSASVALPASISARACSAASDTGSGQSGASTYGSSWRARILPRSPSDDLPKP